MKHRRALLAGLSSAVLLGLAWGCAAVDDSNGSPAGGGGDKAIPDGGNDEYVVTPDSAMPDPDGGIVLNELCGRRPRCVPDDARSSECSGFVPPAASDPDAGPRGDGSQAGASGEGGAGG